MTIFYPKSSCHIFFERKRMIIRKKQLFERDLKLMNYHFVVYGHSLDIILRRSLMSFKFMIVWSRSWLTVNKMISWLKEAIIKENFLQIIYEIIINPILNVRKIGEKFKQGRQEFLHVLLAKTLRKDAIKS